MKNIPNQLSQEAMQELRDIYDEEFDEVLTDGEAQEMGMRLVRFFAILMNQLHQ